jgi:hypothetical protein
MVEIVAECWIVGCRMLFVKGMERSGDDKGDEEMKAT